MTPEEPNHPLALAASIALALWILIIAALRSLR